MRSRVLIDSAAARFSSAGKLPATIFLCATIAFFVYKSIGWHWMFDESIFHYINFLVDKGKIPYRDIIDINMPGTYMVERWALHVFGTGDLGWRMYEYCLLSILMASMIVIALPNDWFAGLLAGVLFVLVHASDGPQMATERDEIMSVLVMAGYAFLFVALRKQWPALMAPFGFLLGLAASIKPTAVPLGFVLLGFAWFTLHKRQARVAAYVGFGLLGVALGWLLVLRFFLETGSFPAFMTLMRNVIPYYMRLVNVSYPTLFSMLIRPWLAVLCLLALLAILLNKDLEDWERWALALGVCFGASSYLAQHKGTSYHRYPFLAFLFLWVSMEFVRAIKRPGRGRYVGYAGVLYCLLLVIPALLFRFNRVPGTIDLPDALQQDLTRLGGANLTNNVECLDTVSGCLAALYRMQLVETQLYMGDSLFFPVEGVARSPYYSSLFWDQIHRDTPKVLILTSEMMSGGGRKGRFDKLKQWPEFESFLNENYRLDTTRNFGLHDYQTAYRIYVRRDDRTQASNKLP